MAGEGNVLERIVELVRKKKEVSLKEACSVFGADEKSLMSLVRILQEHAIVKIRYSLVGDVLLQPGENIDGSMMLEAKKAVATVSKEAVKSEGEVGEFLDMLKAKRLEKRRKGKPE